jgi:hypothetical protein
MAEISMCVVFIGYIGEIKRKSLQQKLVILGDIFVGKMYRLQKKASKNILRKLVYNEDFEILFTLL